MASSQEKTTTYNSAVEQATLLSLVLTRSSFEVTHELQKHKASAEKYITQTLLGPPTLDDGMLMGAVRCRVWMNKADEAGDKKKEGDEAFDAAIFKIEAIYGVFFEVPGDHQKDTLDTFFLRLAPLATWPYFRTHVAQVAAESGLELPILPIKKLLHPVKAAGGYVDPLEMNPAKTAEG